MERDPLVAIHVYLHPPSEPRVRFSRVSGEGANYEPTGDQLGALAEYVNTRLEWGVRVYASGWSARRTVRR